MMSESDSNIITSLEKLRTVGGEALVRKMIGLFLEHAPARVEAARAALAKARWNDVERPAHSLKSSAGTLGLLRIQALAARVEDLSSRGEAGLLPALLDELGKAVEASRPLLQAQLPPP